MVLFLLIIFIVSLLSLMTIFRLRGHFPMPWGKIFLYTVSITLLAFTVLAGMIYYGMKSQKQEGGRIVAQEELANPH